MEARPADHRHASGSDFLADPIPVRDLMPTGQETPA
jgi:hypothetical protein